MIKYKVSTFKVAWQFIMIGSAVIMETIASGLDSVASTAGINSVVNCLRFAIVVYVLI